MCRPPLEVADLIRAAGAAFIERNRHWISGKHLKVLRAIRRCRTAALGGHLDQCTRCGHRAISYNSCRNRHCPKCQASARDRWLEARRRELLPTRYVHVVFTLPRELAPLALQNKKVVYDLLFRSSAETLLEVARDPSISVPKSASSAYCTPGIRSSGFTRMSIVWFLPADSPSITPAGSKIVTPSFSPSRYSVASFAASLWRLSSAPFATAGLGFHGDLTLLAQPKTFSSWLRKLFRNDWVVYSKRPFGGPDMCSIIWAVTLIA